MSDVRNSSFGSAGRITVTGTTNPTEITPGLGKGLENLFPDCITVRLLRPLDMLWLEFRFYNFSLGNSEVTRRSGDSYIVVIFEPQSIAEECGTEDNTGNLHMPYDPSGPAGKQGVIIVSPSGPRSLSTMVADESRLVFSVPESVTSIPLTPDGLLNWSSLKLKVNIRAQDVFVNSLAGINTIKFFDANVKAIIPSTEVFNRPLIKGISKTAVTNLQNNNQIKRVGGQDGFFHFPVRPAPKPGDEPIAMPSEMESSIELPARIFLSPPAGARWLHNIDAKSNSLPNTGNIFANRFGGGAGVFIKPDIFYELWHTRLADADNFIEETHEWNLDKILRALWAVDASPDYKYNGSTDTNDKYLGLVSITADNRNDIVHESSNFSIPGFTPQPVKAKKLFLSAMGGWLDSQFLINRDSLNKAGLTGQLNVLKWRHIATMARDHYVEVVTAGYILPFGHKASLLTITERKPHAKSGTATNFQRTIITITEPIKRYNYRDGDQFLYFPFSKIEMITTVSPLLDTQKTKLVAQDQLSDNIPANNDFIIKADGADVKWHIKAEDLAGNHLDFDMSLAFISADACFDPISGQLVEVKLKDIVGAYNSLFSNLSSAADIKGKKFTLAPLKLNGSSTVYEATHIDFGMMEYLNHTSEPQGFLPTVAEATVIEPSYQRITGITTPVKITLVDDNNETGIFAKLKTSLPTAFSLQSSKTGGFVAPEFNITGLSKAFGPVGGNIDSLADKTAAGALPTAEDYFNGNSKLFGVFKLSDLIAFETKLSSDFDIDNPNPIPPIPSLTTKETDTEVTTSYRLEHELTSINKDLVGINFTSGSPLTMITQVIRQKNPNSNPQFSSSASLKNFTIDIFQQSGWDHGLLYLQFNEVSFYADTNAKTDVNVDIKDGVQFGGPLEFINNFKDLIPSNGFSDPPYLDVSPVGIISGYKLALPDLQLGAFSLSHLSLSAEINLPFTGAPLLVGFKFCERQQPFTLTVGVLGGGGFFGIEADFHGLTQIEASLEFGAAVALNLGVASGSVSIMAGIYFKMEFVTGQGNSTELSGYVRINGAMSVLGLITATLEFYLALSYQIEKKKAYGIATLKIKVGVLFFSKSVSVTTSRTFAGSGGDPNFKMMMPESSWIDYCSAFAA